MKKESNKKKDEAYSVVGFLKFIILPVNDSDKNNDTGKLFTIVSLFAFIVTLILTFMNSAFIPSCMLMLSLLLFSICFRNRDSSNRYVQILFILGVLLIVGSLIYTYMRLN